MSGEILFLAHRVPYPPDRGDKIRSWNVLKAIAALAPTHVVGLLDPADDPETGRAEIGAVATSFHAEPISLSRPQAVAKALLTGQPASVCAFSSGSLMTCVQTLLAERPIRTIYAFSGQMAQFVPLQRAGRRFVMDFVDMDSAKFAAFARERQGLSGFANQMEARRLLAFEKAVANRADMSLFVSAAEAALFRAMSGLGTDRIGVLENGIDLEKFSPERAYPEVDAGGTPLIVFTGQMDYRPNIEAAGVFAREALPLIRAVHPDAVFAIVGRAPTSEVRALSVLPGVLVTGEVPDTRDWLAAADVVVAPLRLARGIQNKVLEAMAMAKPVVTSLDAAQGIDAKSGKELMVAQGSRAEAQAVLKLLANPEKAEALGKAARARMAARYGWDARMAGLPQILGLD
jgi:sugar transferase (PEP-CTERM/EpsH1 system associated)